MLHALGERGDDPPIQIVEEIDEREDEETGSSSASVDHDAESIGDSLGPVTFL